MKSFFVSLPRPLTALWLSTLAVVALGMTSCAPPPKEYDLSPPAFVDRAPIRLDVAEIRVRDDFNPPAGQGHAEHLFPTPPEEAVRLWASQRLKAVGQSRILEVVIEDASVMETKLPRKGGIQGDFTDEPSERYNATIAVSLRLYGGERAISEASAQTKVSRMKEVTEKMSVFARRAVFAQMTRDLTKQMDDSLTQQIGQYFSAHIR